MPRNLKLVIHPAIETERLAALCAAAPELEIVNTGDVAQARVAIEDADAFFGMRVLPVDPRRTDRPPLTLPSPPGGEGKGEGVVAELWRPNELHRLLSASDFVVIAAQHTPHTEKLFRREQFRQMKSTAYLIN